MTTERVQKILARAGIASRRKAEELISEGLVTINGRVAQLGDKASLGKDAIKVQGRLLQTTEPPVYLAFNKPMGVISALSDPEGRATLGDFLGKVKSRVYPVGRLDFNSEGLLLLTNDGDFAEKLQKREDVARVYHVKVKGHPPADQMLRLSKGGRIGHRVVKPHSVRVVQELSNKSRVEVVLMGHGAVDLKTYFMTKGFLVEKITRTAIGHITLKGLEPGQYRHLKASQATALLEQPELGMRKIEQDAEKAKTRPPEGRRERLRKETALIKRRESRQTEAPRPQKRGMSIVKRRSTT